MKTNFTRGLVILLFPFLLMILINECSRMHIKEIPYKMDSIEAMNSNFRTPAKCTWNCHNDTRYCMDNHTKILKPYFDNLNPIYFGMISLLAQTGNYGLANIIFLVFLWPLLMFGILIGIINTFTKINHLKKKHNGFII
jgi:hypothetical protein